MVEGKVKWFNNVRGIGFLTSDAYEGKDIFVHYASIQMEGYRTIDAKQSVKVSVAEGPKGLFAEKVELI